MICEFFKTGLSDGIDLIISAEEFLRAKYDEREWNALKYATTAFAKAGGAEYCIDHTDYVTVRGWLRESKDCEVVFTLKTIEPGTKCCDAYVVTADGPQAVIFNDEDGRSLVMHRK